MKISSEIRKDSIPNLGINGESNSVPVIVDLLAAAKNSEFDKLVIREEVDDIVNAVETSPLSVLVSDQPSEIEEAIKGFAYTLSKNQNLATSYSSCVVVPELWQVEDARKTLAEAVAKAEGGIIFIPSLHEYLFGTNVVTHALDRLVSDAFAKNNVRIITSTTQETWQRIKFRPPYTTLKQPVALLPPSPEKTASIIKNMRPQLESEWAKRNLKVTISDDAIDEAARLGSQYLTDRPQPEAALAIIRRCLTNFKMRSATPEGTIGAEDVRKTLSDFGFEVSIEDPQKYLQMKQTLQRRIVGQDEAIDAVTRVIKSAKSGFKNPRLPIGSFIFVGPSGVGKTELAKQLSVFLFNDEKALIQLDMSEYQERHNVARLIGSPPGYVGYEEGGQLTEAVRRKPYSVVLFDEIEKAHPDTFNIFLQIVGDGRLTDGKGRTIDFRNTVPIFTCNVGSEHYRDYETLGRQAVVNLVNEDLTRVFRPEFLGRIKEKVVFNVLVNDALAKIIDLRVNDINANLAKERGIQIELSPEVKSFINTQGQSNVYGARNLQHTLERYVTESEELTDGVLSGKFKPGSIILVSLVDGKVNFTLKG